MTNPSITIYTDGSCNTQTSNGAWAAIILSGEQKTVLHDTAKNTTHNRMELTAVIKAIDFAVVKYPGANLEIYTDSQYVVNLPERMEKLLNKNFITKKGNELNNSDLLQMLISHVKSQSINFIKVKAHLKSSDRENLNREVDMICRRVMRESICR
jgi:ribonuclease HI